MVCVATLLNTARCLMERPWAGQPVSVLGVERGMKVVSLSVCMCL